MSAVGSDVLQNNATARSASQNDQAAGPSVLPPLSGKLSVDENLKLSNENFKETISDFFQDKNVNPLSQLTATPAFPTPHVLAQFASKAYLDYETGETDAQYETRLDLPDGWKLLTTASNDSKTNGYFGAAYWNPEHQQVVIAHRGTKPTNLGAIFTDVIGVMFKLYVWQMESAGTFAHKVVEVLRGVRGVSFQLFFTGHSLGGWLAQITTFTTEYLKTDSKIFLQSNNDQNFHPHTIVFDSPGCKDMLLQMRNAYFARLDVGSIDIEHLDITSYLSAPNRINTCNTHVGTVYRIFTDLSDTGSPTGLGGTVYRIFPYLADAVDAVWQITRPAFYNIETHSMKKILQAFDPETGLVRKDEQGQLKVQVVIDWPISTGLTGGEEYKKFFEWTEHLNNYHLDITNESFRYLNYYPIRYKTKLYNERVKSFNIFSEKEKEFLQCYLWLRQWPELIKPKELFSEIKESKAQEEAKKILECFEIKRGTIRCRDAGALQVLIPYVKRLLQLFPGIKEDTKLALSSDKVRKSVYQFETMRYIERIICSPLEVKSDTFSFREFLEVEQKQVLHLLINNVDEWTGLTMVYQVFQKNRFLIEDQYTILTLNRFITINQFMDFSKLMLKTITPYLVMIACKGNQQLDDETKDVIRKLFDTIKQKRNIKIIFITRTAGSIVAFLHHLGRDLSGKGFLRRAEELTWSDLTKNSQEKLLEKSVKFQGAKISLSELMSAESPVANLLPLGPLLEETDLNIADPVPISHAYKESYYIGRTFCNQITIKQEVLSDNSQNKFPDLIATSQQEFKRLCQMNPQKNVHRLVKDKREQLIWRKTQGSLESLRRYIDTERSHTYTADDLNKLLKQAQYQRVMLISDTAGMGKSTVLTHLSKQIKEKFPAKWVVRIDLNDHTDALNALRKEHIEKKKAFEFIWKKMLKLKPGLEVELFKQCCEQKQKVRIVIMLDGFDEISPDYKETVVTLLQALRQTAVEQLWVTTRPHLKEKLEDKLHQLSYTLEPFSEKNQIEFLTKFWSSNTWFSEMKNKGKEESKKKLEVYAKELIKNLGNSISDKDKEFTGIPLQIRMLAEAFDREVKINYHSAESMPDLQFQLDLLGLYGRFIERKYDIYYEDKLQVPVYNVVAKAQRERDLKVMRKDHQLLALKVLFTEEQVTSFEIDSHFTFSNEELARIGIAELNYGDKLQFIHRTFAEFFVADFFVNQLNKGTKVSSQVQDCLLKDIFLKADYRVVRVFIDGLMSSCFPPQKVLKEFGNGIHDLGKDSDMVLHTAAREGNANIIGLLLDSLEAAGYKGTLVKVLLAEDKYRQTAFLLAAVWRNIQALELLWEWGKKNLKTTQLNNRYLLAKDSRKNTAWHVAAEEGHLEIIQRLWKWAKEVEPGEELRKKLLLAKDSRGNMAFHIAAKSGRADVFQKIWEYAEEGLRPEELKSEVLLATEQLGQTVWHCAIWKGNIHLLQKLWELAEEKLEKEELIDKLLLAKNNRGKTAWHMATECGNLKLLQQLWEWVRRKETTEGLNKNLLLTKDSRQRTAWHLAAESGKLELLQEQWEWAKEVLTAEERNDNLLLAADDNDQTFLHVAAKRNDSRQLEQLWDWTTENLTQENIKELLFAKDDQEQTVLQVVDNRQNREAFEKMLEWVTRYLSPDEERIAFSQRRY